MNLLNFVSTYPDESSCREAFKLWRDKSGVVCPHCGCKEHYWKQDKACYECKQCHTRQSLRSHTVMHGSQLPFRYWLITMYLLTSTKKSFRPPNCSVSWGTPPIILYGPCFTNYAWLWVSGIRDIV